LDDYYYDVLKRADASGR